MKFQDVILLLTFSVLLSACEDVPSNRSKKQETIRPPVVVEPVGVYSGIHRSRGSAPITYKTEIGLNSNHADIRNIPDIHFDDEGSDGKNVIPVRARPVNICGLAGVITLKAKIADCLAKNPGKSIWNGTINAGSAESTWELVTFAEKDAGTATYEIWRDNRTGMVWSDIVTLAGNWCEASGSQLPIETNAVGIDCGLAGLGKSICTIDYSLVDLPKVNWRLPTRHDYLQADIDGIRFVLSSPPNTFFWTATVTSDVKARDKAWTYNMTMGTLIAEPMITTRAVRCIGTPNF